MPEEKKEEKGKEKEVISPQRDLDAIFKAHVATASKELATLLDSYGLELRVNHTIQLVPKRKA